MDFVFLTPEFYTDHAAFTQIETKAERPYIQVKVLVNGILFCVPLRSNIRHPHVLWTDKENKCGVDFSKAVVIAEPEKYIVLTKKPHIRQNEFDSLRGKEYIIQQKLVKFISDYKKAKEQPEIQRNKNILQFSALQYFEQHL